MRQKDATFLTIRECAKTGLVSERFLRSRLQQGRLPGFYSGKWFMVDYQALVDLLRSEAQAQIKEEQ